ncbi:MAG: hypothetical protein H7839_09335 [Magnetococcus sp. YQC-5]
MNDTSKFDTHLVELKNLLMTATEFNSVFHFFFDHLGENVEFMRSGKFYKNPDLKKIMFVIGKGIFKDEEITVSGLMLKLVQKHLFIHGVCHINGQLVTLFFFRSINMGMAATSDPSRPSNTLFIRFTTMMEANRHLSLQNVSGPTIH